MGRRWWLVPVCVLGLLLGACGDSNLFEGVADDGTAAAREEEALAALNDGDYALAVELFTELYEEDDSPELARYLAAAYVGLAGFDMLELLDAITQAQEAEEDVETVVYGSVTELFDENGDGLILAPELEEKLGYVEAAVEYLLASLGGGARTALGRVALRTPIEESVLVQIGLYSAVETVLGIVGQLEADPGNPESVLYLTLEELASDPAVIDRVVAPAGLDDALSRVSQALDVLRGEEEVEDDGDLAGEFDAFLTAIGYLGGASPGHVTDTELQAYLHGLVAEVEP